MKLTNLYDIAENQNIKINNWKMPDTRARIIDNEYTAIFIDYSKIDSYVSEKEVLAEELGHYYNSAYYTLLDDQNFINKQEYKAKKWKCLSLCPINDLRECFFKGIIKLSDIAEELQLDPRTVKFAYDYYVENNLLKINI